MKYSIAIIIALVVITTSQLFAQMPAQEVRKRLDLIYSGQVERVRTELPMLQQQYPNDPGVEYLDAVLTTDGTQAVKKFQTIVDVHPQSEWADDALYKVYQYYYSLGLYKTADQKMEQLKHQYPNSIYATGATTSSPPAHNENLPEEPAAPAKDTTVILPNRPENISRQTSTQENLPAAGKFAVQVGAFSTSQNAQKQVDVLASFAISAVTSTKDAGGRTWYVVSVEGFATEQEARAFITELKTKHNINAIIVTR
ncbi:MAG: SPOR domain-containing protein [Bacteroidota bacterium]|nr:SPOR domain-containing protein [Bacteroidota bacterium]